MDEPDLVTGLKAGETAAAEELIDRYGDRLFRSACLLCGQETDAQDLVQETFIQCMESAHRFRGESSLYTWLHGILLNLTRHYHRKRRRMVYTDELPTREAPETRGPDRLDREAAASALCDALKALSQPHREVVVLRYYENMKIDDIATHTGVSKGTVKSRLHYAKSRLRELIPAGLNLFAPTGTQE